MKIIYNFAIISYYSIRRVEHYTYFSLKALYSLVIFILKTNLFSDDCTHLSSLFHKHYSFKHYFLHHMKLKLARKSTSHQKMVWSIKNIV